MQPDSSASIDGELQPVDGAAQFWRLAGWFVGLNIFFRRQMCVIVTPTDCQRLLETSTQNQAAEGGASSHTWTPSSSSSSGGDGGGDFTSASSPSDGSFFFLESFLAAMNPPSDSVFLLLVEEGKRATISISCQGKEKQGKSQNFLEVTTLVKVHLCVASRVVAIFDLSV